MSQNTVEKQILKNRGTLGKSELLALGVGQVIGAGVITLVGQAAGLTGRSAWLAYGIAVIIGLVMVVPYVFLSSAIIVKGGSYSVIKAMSGERLAGMYVVSYITQCLSLSLMGTSLGIYLQSLWPVLDPKVVAIVFLLLFYVINLLGVSSMAKVQRIMSAILVFCLMMFIVAGVSKLDSATLNFADSDFTSCDFTRCRFVECDFTNTTLYGADFSYGEVHYCNFQDADMAGCILNEANLEDSDFALSENLSACRFDEGTIWPDTDKLPEDFDSSYSYDLSSLQDEEEHQESDYMY